MTEIDNAVVTTTKRRRRCKTHWFNVLVAVFAALEASFHLIQPYVSGDIYSYICLVLILGNVFLREISKQGVAKW